MPVTPEPSRLLRALVRIFFWLPLAAVVVLAGIAFGWRIPAAIGGFYVLLFLPLKIDLSRRRGASRWLRHDKSLAAVMAVVGGILGAAIFGGPGFVFGATAGLVFGISAFIPLSIKNENGELVPTTSATQPRRRHCGSRSGSSS